MGAAFDTATCRRCISPGGQLPRLCQMAGLVRQRHRRPIHRELSGRQQHRHREPAGQWRAGEPAGHLSLQRQRVGLQGRSGRQLGERQGGGGCDLLCPRQRAGRQLHLDAGHPDRRPPPALCPLDRRLGQLGRRAIQGWCMAAGPAWSRSARSRMAGSGTCWGPTASRPARARKRRWKGRKSRRRTSSDLSNP
jgi:hypothetical protein